MDLPEAVRIELLVVKILSLSPLAQGHVIAQLYGSDPLLCSKVAPEVLRRLEQKEKRK